MKYLKTFEIYKNKNSLRHLTKDELDKIQDGQWEFDLMTKNDTDDNYYKVTEIANNWYYKIKYYYKKPGCITYCFLKTDGPNTSQFWIEEDKLLIPSLEEIEKYEMIKLSKKYNIG